MRAIVANNSPIRYVTLARVANSVLERTRGIRNDLKPRTSNPKPSFRVFSSPLPVRLVVVVEAVQFSAVRLDAAAADRLGRRDGTQTQRHRTADHRNRTGHESRGEGRTVGVGFAHVAARGAGLAVERHAKRRTTPRRTVCTGNGDCFAVTADPALIVEVSHDLVEG